METSRYLERLAIDHARLAEVAASGLAEKVPTCPDWSVEDLTRHVAQVYLHKVACMRTGSAPQAWPPDLSGESPLDLLDRAYAELRGEFATRSPGSPAYTWYEPDQTVAFWIRRMAQETVVHRVDAELAAGTSIADIPDDLAHDGIDEMLRVMLAYGIRRWPEGFAEVLPDSALRVLVTTGEQSWLLGLDATGATVEPGSADQPVHTTISGAPQELLLWLWRRTPDHAVRRTGDRHAADTFRAVLGAATQ
ncbi:maleylpyruvate isomerase family mycothiol-dependent enzyme [Micromonospora sp. NBC_01796]|uniref:maleylpyruvate isomerase family mycothiol-dependent enzyme n=1 Tax=Micromonospora sp. NBC_01796 TaxID=2975987 RepID=UPI002DDC28AC|nr:maleylpyruvate isomerase family mycothiol-dependent enzyme [Micromonospora sp. NBC_01796]WSA87998.1 maleylpyruvate isomerase family mycothiol-dependent enzyme [Micromonospora sp. NBC_01796]